MEKRVEIRVQAGLLERFEEACKANYTTRSEILRQAMLDYVRQNSKEANDVRRVEKVQWDDGVEKRLKELGWDHTKLYDEARKRATYSGIFTDDSTEATDNQYLVEDMSDVINAHYNDLLVELIHDIDWSEVDDGAEAFCKRHRIEILN